MGGNEWEAFEGGLSNGDFQMGGNLMGTLKWEASKLLDSQTKSGFQMEGFELGSFGWEAIKWEDFEWEALKLLDWRQ